MIKRNTRFLATSFIAILLSFLLSSAVGWASHEPPRKCTTTTANTKTTSVAATDGHTTPHDSQGAGGAPEGFDPTPLITTDVNVGGAAPSCLVAQVSVHHLTAYGFGDQLAVYQVKVDGEPMFGHTTWCHTSGGASFSCLAFDNTNAGAGITAASYHLYFPVSPGNHRVEVLYAGCCRGQGAYSAGAVLTLYHR